MPNLIKQFYLLFYNACSLLGWILVFSSTIRPLSTLLIQIINGDGIRKINWYEECEVERIVLPLQTAAVLELLNAAIGLVRSPMFTAIIQVGSRLVVVWPIWYYVRAASAIHSYFLPLTLMAWSTSEIIRYTYYGLLQLRIKPYPVYWLRYTVFMVLYPAGILGEVGSIWHSLSKMKQEQFALYIAFWTILLLYVPGSVVLFNHMLVMRRKNLGKAVDKAKAT